MTRKDRLFWPIVVAWFLADLLTKEWAVRALTPGNSVNVIGDYGRFTITRNPGMAFGLSLGDSSRWILIAVTLLTIGLIIHLYREVRERDTLQIVALALVLGGAAGNLLDRFRSAAGVVDFIDVGIGAHRFWLFNVADAGISVGGVTLALTLWKISGQRQNADETGIRATDPL